MLKAYKYRLYPTSAQSELLNKHMGSVRLIYNLALETKNQAYASSKVSLTHYQLMAQLPDLKSEFEWLKEVDSQALQQSIIDLDQAFKSFFKGKTGFPKFKNRKSRQSYRNPHGKQVRINGNRIHFPKFTEGVRFVQDREFKGEVRSYTVSKTPTGKYFISLLVETGIKPPEIKPIKESTTIGIDLGLSHFIITDNGMKVDNPRHLKKAQLKLKYLQRQASKKSKGSANRKKANLKVAIQHERISNKRKDFLHKLSTKLVSDNQTLCFEDLSVSNMVKNHTLAQSISDASWSSFVQMCKYKCEWQGKNLIQIPRFEPSTKICSNCGATNHNLTLKDRKWDCDRCGVHHDRDINAAKNIKAYALRGVHHRRKPVELPTLVGAMKQEYTESVN